MARTFRSWITTSEICIASIRAVPVTGVTSTSLHQRAGVKDRAGCQRISATGRVQAMDPGKEPVEGGSAYVEANQSACWISDFIYLAVVLLKKNCRDQTCLSD
jgi:hypothetical protein